MDPNKMTVAALIRLLEGRAATLWEDYLDIRKQSDVTSREIQAARNAWIDTGNMQRQLSRIIFDQSREAN